MAALVMPPLGSVGDQLAWVCSVGRAAAVSVMDRLLGSDSESDNVRGWQLHTAIHYERALKHLEAVPPMDEMLAMMDSQTPAQIAAQCETWDQAHAWCMAYMDLAALVVADDAEQAQRLERFGDDVLRCWRGPHSPDPDQVRAWMPPSYHDEGNAPESCASTSEFVDSLGTAGTEGTALNYQDFSGSLTVPSSELSGNRPEFDEYSEEAEEEPERPSYATYTERTEYGPPGLYFHGWHRARGDNPPAPLDQWIASPIYAEAITAAPGGGDYGLLLRFCDPDRRWHEWAMPMALLAGSGEEQRRELLGLGVRIDPACNPRFKHWLMSAYPVRRVLAVTQTGWHGPDLFILPNANIGAADDVIFQSEQAAVDTYRSAGTLEGWQQEIAALCLGNPVLAVAVSFALAGPILHPTHRQGAGLHLVGDSSSGKSTALAVAASCWGGPDYIRTWRATGNGLEGVAAAHNDTCLILDEIGEADPREVGAIVYALGNGIGKSRANRSGAARPVKRWRVVLLSSGERTLAAHMAEGGRATKAGQELRLLDLPAARVHGCFDHLHLHPDGRAFADHLKTACSRHYGHAGPAFIERLTRHDVDLAAMLAETLERPGLKAENGQEARAATAFGLAGLAGEIATRCGVLPWQQGEAMHAAEWGFNTWRANRGNGQTETRQILQAVADFIARHGDSRFSCALVHGDPVRDRAGWWRDQAGSNRIYLFTSAGLREATKGHDFRRVLAALESAGWIVENDPGRRTKKTKVGGTAHNLYAIRPSDTEAE